MSARTKLSAVIITFNEEKKIDRCLRSLNWVDEIVVVDSFSTDRTFEICRRYTDKVYQHPWPHSSSEQRKIADQYASNDWILALDADEVVTTALRDEIRRIFRNESAVDVFYIPRREYFAGKWIKAGGWYPQYKSILYRKSRGQWSGPIHLKFITTGATSYLSNPILHDGYVSYRILMDKFNYYSTIEADVEFTVRHKKFSFWTLFFKPWERFFGRFIKNKGYKDGIHGLYMAAVVAINYFLREMKIFENYYMSRHVDTWESTYRNLAVGAQSENDSKGDLRNSK